MYIINVCLSTEFYSTTERKKVTENSSLVNYKFINTSECKNSQGYTQTMVQPGKASQGRLIYRNCLSVHMSF